PTIKASGAAHGIPEAFISLAGSESFVRSAPRAAPDSLPFRRSRGQRTTRPGNRGLRAEASYLSAGQAEPNFRLAATRPAWGSRDDARVMTAHLKRLRAT